MSKKQFCKNLDLSSKLALYFVKNPNVKIPEGASFVVFSANDKELNKINTQLYKKLLEKGARVIKAEETKSRKMPWVFTPSFA